MYSILILAVVNLLRLVLQNYVGMALHLVFKIIAPAKNVSNKFRAFKASNSIRKHANANKYWIVPRTFAGMALNVIDLVNAVVHSVRPNLAVWKTTYSIKIHAYANHWNPAQLIFARMALLVIQVKTAFAHKNVCCFQCDRVKQAQNSILRLVDAIQSQTA